MQISELKSGQLFFEEKKLEAMELDEFENPGMIWVERGSELFNIQNGE